MLSQSINQFLLLNIGLLEDQHTLVVESTVSFQNKDRKKFFKKTSNPIRN